MQVTIRVAAAGCEPIINPIQFHAHGKGLVETLSFLSQSFHESATVTMELDGVTMFTGDADSFASRVASFQA